MINKVVNMACVYVCLYRQGPCVFLLYAFVHASLTEHLYISLQMQQSSVQQKLCLYSHASGREIFIKYLRIWSDKDKTKNTILPRYTQR